MSAAYGIKPWKLSPPISSLATLAQSTNSPLQKLHDLRSIRRNDKDVAAPISSRLRKSGKMLTAKRTQPRSSPTPPHPDSSPAVPRSSESSERASSSYPSHLLFLSSWPRAREKDVPPEIKAPFHKAHIVLSFFTRFPAPTHRCRTISAATSSAIEEETHDSISPLSTSSGSCRRNFSSAVRASMSGRLERAEAGGAEREMMRVRR